MHRWSRATTAGSVPYAAHGPTMTRIPREKRLASRPPEQPFSDPSGDWFPPSERSPMRPVDRTLSNRNSVESRGNTTKATAVHARNAYTARLNARKSPRIVRKNTKISRVRFGGHCVGRERCRRGGARRCGADASRGSRVRVGSRAALRPAIRTSAGQRIRESLPDRFPGRVDRPRPNPLGKSVQLAGSLGQGRGGSLGFGRPPAALRLTREVNKEKDSGMLDDHPGSRCGVRRSPPWRPRQFLWRSDLACL